MTGLIPRLPQAIKTALADRLDVWEILEFLEVPTEEVIEIFEDEILENLGGILELAGISTIENANDND